MKKLILVVLLLIAVLLLSWWAKTANFSLFTMMNSVAHPPVTSGSTLTGQPSPTLTPIPVEIIITITPSGFVPDVLMISPHTKITWINKSSTTANISSDPTTAYTALNLGDVGDNGSVSYTFTQDGRYHYENGKNPSQKGTLVVK